jgi:hypothetical protein
MFWCVNLCSLKSPAERFTAPRIIYRNLLTHSWAEPKSGAGVFLSALAMAGWHQKTRSKLDIPFIAWALGFIRWFSFAPKRPMCVRAKCRPSSPTANANRIKNFLSTPLLAARARDFVLRKGFESRGWISYWTAGVARVVLGTISFPSPRGFYWNAVENSVVIKEIPFLRGAARRLTLQTRPPSNSVRCPRDAWTADAIMQIWQAEIIAVPLIKYRSLLLKYCRLMVWIQNCLVPFVCVLSLCARRSKKALLLSAFSITCFISFVAGKRPFFHIGLHLQMFAGVMSTNLCFFSNLRKVCTKTIYLNFGLDKTGFISFDNYKLVNHDSWCANLFNICAMQHH